MVAQLCQFYKNFETEFEKNNKGFVCIKRFAVNESVKVNHIYIFIIYLFYFHNLLFIISCYHQNNLAKVSK